MTRRPFQSALVQRIGFALATAGTLVAGGCESPAAYQQQTVWRLDGAPVEAPPYAHARAWTTTVQPEAGQDYQYRGGRDPKTGRASIQM
jgi:hypothetical protein